MSERIVTSIIIPTIVKGPKRFRGNERGLCTGTFSPSS